MNLHDLMLFITLIADDADDSKDPPARPDPPRKPTERRPDRRRPRE